MDRACLTVMAFTNSFRDLEVWQESMTLVEEIYAISKSFPREELFGLTAQLRKAAYQSRRISVREHAARNGV
jgi:four helix bundle protein